MVLQPDADTRDGINKLLIPNLFSNAAKHTCKVWFQKMSIPPPPTPTEGIGNSWRWEGGGGGGGGGGLKGEIFKEMYEAISRGVGDLLGDSSCTSF